MVDKSSAEHYFWKEVCEGWHLVKSNNLSVIQERMPPHTAEDCHLHKQVRQFFFVLSGRVTLEVEGEQHILNALEGLEVLPNQAHQVRNDSEADAEFLVVSSGLSRSDRWPV